MRLFSPPVLDCRHVIYRHASASALTLLDSEVYRSALRFTVSWTIRWDEKRATLPQHFIKPVTRLLFYTFKRLLHAWCCADKHNTAVTVGQFGTMTANNAVFERTRVFNGVYFAAVCLVLFFLIIHENESLPSVLPSRFK